MRSPQAGALLNQQRYMPFGGVRENVGTITPTEFGKVGPRHGVAMKESRGLPPFLIFCASLALGLGLAGGCSQLQPQPPAPGNDLLFETDTGSIASLAWNRAGDKLAATELNEARSQIVVYDLSSASLKGLLAGGDVSVTDWSPLDDRLVIVGAQPAAGGSLASGVWLLDLENNETTFLAAGTDLAYSPNGRTMAVLDTNETQVTIRLLEPASTEATTIFITSGQHLSASAISWSPLGRQLVLALSPGEGYAMDLVMIDADSGNLTGVTKDGYNYSPSWSPDGKWIAYVADKIGWDASRVMVLAADDASCVGAVPGTAGATFASYSPTGSIAFAIAGKVFLIAEEEVRGFTERLCRQ